MEKTVLIFEKSNFEINFDAYLIRRTNIEKPDEQDHKTTIYVDNETVDDKHALIVTEEENSFVYDLNSRVGTFVNDVRLPVLTKFRLYDNATIRFGSVEATFKRCSTLEQNHSSGFHEDTIHLHLEQSSIDAENFTLPDTQLMVPGDNANVNSSKADNTNISNDSIPETQDFFEAAKTNLPSNANSNSINESGENELLELGEEFNCSNDEDDGNSKDLLVNLDWLIGDEQSTSQTIKQTTDKKKTVENNPQNDTISSESKPNDSDMQSNQDGSRSLTHTPDLFDVGLLNEFEKRESRIQSARANRAQNEGENEEQSDELIQNSNEKSDVNERTSSFYENRSIATTPPMLNVNEKSSDQQSNEKSDADRVELDLFEGRRLDNELNLSGLPPLEHSNKENMFDDEFEPTSVNPCKKAMNPPAEEPPMMVTSISNDPSDLEKTQVFIPKKNANSGAVKAFDGNKNQLPQDEMDLEPTQVRVPKKTFIAGIVKPLDGSKDILPEDEMDLEPTQVRVPKKNENAGIKRPIEEILPQDEKDLEPTQICIPKKKQTNIKKNSVGLSSTLVQNEPTTSRCAKSFFAEIDKALFEDADQQPTCSVKTQIMLTPEFLSDTFAKEKPPDSATRRNLLSRPDYDEENDDALARFLAHQPQKTDFDSLMNSLKKTEDNSVKDDDSANNNSDDLLLKYMGSSASAVENDSKNNADSNAKTQSSCSSNKRATSEDSLADLKRPKLIDSVSDAIPANDKVISERENRQLKRHVAFSEDVNVIPTKTMKVNTMPLEDDKLKGRSTRNLKTADRTEPLSSVTNDLVSESKRQEPILTRSRQNSKDTKSSSTSSSVKANIIEEDNQKEMTSCTGKDLGKKSTKFDQKSLRSRTNSRDTQTTSSSSSSYKAKKDEGNSTKSPPSTANDLGEESTKFNKKSLRSRTNSRDTQTTSSSSSSYKAKKDEGNSTKSPPSTANDLGEESTKFNKKSLRSRTNSRDTQTTSSSSSSYKAKKDEGNSTKSPPSTARDLGKESKKLNKKSPISRVDTIDSKTTSTSTSTSLGDHSETTSSSTKSDNSGSKTSEPKSLRNTRSRSKPNVAKMKDTSDINSEKVQSKSAGGTNKKSTSSESTSNKSKNTRETSIEKTLSTNAKTKASEMDLQKRTTRSRQKKDPIKQEEEKDRIESEKLVEPQSSIIDMQGKRTTRFQSIITTSQETSLRCQSVISTSQETTSSSSSLEIPSTSSKTLTRTRRNAPNIDLRTPDKSSSCLKLAFTMVDPERKEHLLTNRNRNKWIEVQDPTESEILIMDTGNRTIKFLIAVAKGIPIVRSDWLEAVQATGSKSVGTNYFFKDANFERNFRFNLLKTLCEAKKERIFKNFKFLLTNNIVPNPNDMKMIITCAGGIVLEDDNVPEENDIQHLYLISSERDQQYWHTYRRKNSNICITSTESVMLAIMRYDYKILKKRSF